MNYSVSNCLIPYNIKGTVSALERTCLSLLSSLGARTVHVVIQAGLDSTRSHFKPPLLVALRMCLETNRALALPHTRSIYLSTQCLTMLPL